MGYRSALQAAGAKVKAFQDFGSYQGDWYALVEYNGETGWVHGWYGSCSGCDSFEGEFGYGMPESVGMNFYDEETGEWRDAIQEDVDAYRERLAAFGRTYLDGLLSQKAVEKIASENKDWDEDAPKMLSFLKEHAFGAQVR